jgi:alpha-galactosidase
MGNDLRIIAPQDLAILSNAAVIAVNQDPLGQSASRRWLYNGDSGGSGIQLWSGNLKGTVHKDYNDYVVLLVNGNNNMTVMNATLNDIFSDSGPRGHAPQVGMSWEVRDLWTGRMSNETAQAIIDASAATSNTTQGYNTTNTSDGRYNSTATSYADGLAANNTILLGTVTTTIEPSGTLTAAVDRHGAAMFRLRAIPPGIRKRDEL